MLTRRHSLLAGAGLALPGLLRSAHAQAPVPRYEPSPALVEAARKEGRLVLYTASFTEVEQETAAQFNKRFPFVRIEIIRASGGQLITRVRTEAAAGKLVADVVDHSDRALMKGIEDLFVEYAPPNGADYLETARISDRIWPRITPVWALAYNSELLQKPPTSWADLTDAARFKPGTLGQVIAPSGGTTWTRIMFERQVMGDDYWAKQAATKPTLYPSSAPLADAVVRGEVLAAPVVRNVVYSKVKDGAPVKLVYPTEGIPVCPYATGIPKSSTRQNAARLFLDWSMSVEGQSWTMAEQGNLTSLRAPPRGLAGFDPAVHKIWLPEQKPFETLRDPWTEEWNKTFGYRQ